MHLDVVALSRLQFALTISFHYLFPPLTIGLGTLMVFMEAVYLRTGDKQYEVMTKFWSRIFAVNFALGVASGIVMEFQFGTNWSGYSRFVGDVFGSALAAEGIFAFFLESGFLAVMIFGWGRVSATKHFISTLMVALGSIFSAVWIVVANSWQQTPAGYHLVGQGPGVRAEITDFWAVVFNPSSMNRLSHTLVGAFILGAFFVMSVSAYYILRGRHLDFAKKCFTIALIFAAVTSVGQLFLGHAHAIQVARTQPEKLAAFEGHFETGTGGAPIHLFGIPNTAERRVDYAVTIPGMLSWLVSFDPTKPVPGLDQYAQKDWPPVGLPFFGFHVMVGLGMYFIALTLFSVLMLIRGKLFGMRWLLWVYVFSVIGPYIANQLGWASAEVGRQPWIVYHVLRTSDAVSKVVPAGQVLASNLLFGLIYVMLFAVWIYVVNDKIHKGPDAAEMPATSDLGDFLETSALMEDPAGPSLTSAKNGEAKPTSGEEK
ncbi:MAG TPA: cytochrome ubiquinol oxidase subunit I [Armatimonadota bacterium]|jgi:cytochrome d ubiquinol oxidase subunit I